MSEEILHGFTCGFVHEDDSCKLVDILVDENRKLREREGNLFNAVIAKSNELLDLLCETERLRELASILCYCMHESTDCDGCKLNDGRGEMGLDAFFACDGLHELLRELGVES